MSLLPRWSDDLSTDPFLDPAYSITSGASGWTYNASLDQLENNTSGGVLANFTKLNSNNAHGIVEADLGYFYSTGSDNTAISIRAFGYWFISGEKVSEKFIAVSEEELTPADFISAGILQSTLGFLKYNRRLIGPFSVKIVGTPVGVFFYVDNVLEFVAPPRIANGNTTVQLYRSGGGTGGVSFVSRLLIKSDSSLPKTPPILVPGISGGLSATDGPVVVQVPESRLYLDLGAFEGRIGTGGLTNVVYDPGGANVPMAEDTGIPDGSGGTIGDYYLEAPVRGVASDNRLVIKEAFVTANSVVVTDTIDFDIVNGPTGQSGTVVEEDDLHCYLEKHSVGMQSQNVLRPIYPPNTNIALHNTNADGNDPFIISGGSRSRVVGSDGTSQIANVTRLKFSSSAAAPFIFDLDFLRIRRISKIFFVNYDPEGGVKDLNTADIYSSPVPFSGPSLLQGTLEVDNYAPHIFRAGIGSQNLDHELWKVFAGGPVGDIDIKTRYLRLVFNNDNLSGNSSSNGFNLGRQFGFFEQIELADINSVDDNAQFEFDSGGGFVAFPAGGVPQSGGNVRITLDPDTEHDGNSPNYYRILFKPDITD